MKHIVNKICTYKFFILGIFLLASMLRLYGMDWDQRYHLHPDERAIIISATALRFPHSFTEFVNPQSPWNPHFFAYGSLPLYLLHTLGDIFAGVDPLFATYDKIDIIGRSLSTLADLGTLFFLIMIAKKLYGKKTALVAGFFYAIAVLPIQLSHFYAVDTLLTFFILLTLYQLICFYEHPSLRKAIGIGISFGLALVTKISATVLFASLGIALTIDFLLLVYQQPHKPYIWFPHMPHVLIKRLKYVVTIGITIGIVFVIIEPYALIDFTEFWQQTQQQATMTHNPFVFPYTLQYVGKKPYLYEVKNIFFWGLGPMLSFFAFVGIIYCLYLSFAKKKEKHWAQELIVWSFFCVYFFVVGKFAIGFMRYMLPLYPLMCLAASVVVIHMIAVLGTLHKGFRWLLIGTIVAIAIWPFAFIHIYTQPNTRVQATDWINANIPQGATLAIEHWDDSLPLIGQEKYRMETLELYNPDSAEKWAKVNQQLAQADYIIIASNRLYTPLQKLVDCRKLPLGYCYRQTAAYYRNLFSGALGFKKVAEFTDYPRITFGSYRITIPDDNADESFTVYDHPKIIIFHHERTSEK